MSVKIVPISWTGKPVNLNAPYRYEVQEIDSDTNQFDWIMRTDDKKQAQDFADFRQTKAAKIMKILDNHI